MKARLKKDIVIPKGTVMESDGCIKSEYFVPQEDIVHTIGFGADATADLRIGTEFGNKEFDKWFERVE
jgi:hypothetical protein